jgi:hypothetical protein
MEICINNSGHATGFDTSINICLKTGKLLPEDPNSLQSYGNKTISASLNGSALLHHFLLGFFFSFLTPFSIQYFGP